MSDNTALQTGAWAAELDALISAMLSGQGSDTDLPDPVRFRLAVHRLVVAREKRPDCELDRAAAMVLVPPAFLESVAVNTVRRPTLNTGKFPLTGQLHFLNIVASGRSMDYLGNEGDLFDALDKAQVGAYPTVVYTPQAGGQSTLSWYPAGTSQETNVFIVPVKLDEPTPDLLAQAINGVYHGHLITPDQIPDEASPWTKPSAGWAAKNAEAIVQQAVKIGLHGRFPLCRIVAEQPGKDGRTDIEVVGDFGRAPGDVTNYAVLELKVLREKGSTGKVYTAKGIAGHINDGVDQAYGYGSGRNFESRLLCLFDMRGKNNGPAPVLAPVQAKAKTLGVGLHYWFLYRSSKKLRACKVGKALKAG